MQLVDNQHSLDTMVQKLEGAEQLFLDTEFESNRDGKTLCLLQLSRGEEVYLVDPLRLKALKPLAELLSSDAEWVVHAGLQDVELLVRDLKLSDRPPVFDTQVAWGLLSAEPSVSLAYLMFRVLGIRAGKAHQADDWRRRPLPDSQLRYAADDVAHLPELRRRLGERARELKREHLIVEASLDLLWPDPEPPPPISLASFRNAWQLDRESQAALRFLIDWYNDLSPRERDEAPPQKTLLSIASRLPEDGAAMGRIKGVPGRWAARHGNRLTGQLMRATAEAKGDEFVPIDPPPYATFEEIRLDAWLGAVRAAVANQLQVAPELLLPGRRLRRLRDAYLDGGVEQATGMLSGWRHELAAQSFREWCEKIPQLTDS